MRPLRPLYKARSGLKHDGIFRKSTTISFHIPSYSIMYPHWFPFSFIGLHLPTWPFYTCQLFLRYKREIFILGVLGFLKTTRSFPKIPEEVRSLPKTSEVCRSLPKASSLPVLFTSKIRDREEGIVIYSFYAWFSFLTWVWVNIFLELCQARRQQLRFFNQAWEIGPQAWAGVRLKFSTRRRETHA